MSDSDLQTLTDFRSEVPEPDEETARRIYALSTAPMAGRRRDMGCLTRSRRSRLELRLRHVRPRRRLGITAAGVALAASGAVAAFLTVGSSGVTPGVENAAAAIRKAVSLTAALPSSPAPPTSASLTTASSGRARSSAGTATTPSSTTAPSTRSPDIRSWS